MEKATNKLKQLHTDYKQSIWLDFIDRAIMRSGKLQQLITEDGIRGVTSNPAIFAQAISASADYDEDIQKLGAEFTGDEELFYQLAIKDIRQAADLFLPVYNEEVSGADGYVSLEVSPLLAMDGESTSRQAMKLWLAVDRKNVMIKIPATKPCLESVRLAISQGININVTLIFGLDRYRAVALAYIEGLEQRHQAGLDISGVASVASFFMSRIDIQLDPVLDSMNKGELKGESAIALGKMAYVIYEELYSSDRWKKLEAAGGKPQRLLWASTGNKNPAYRDTRYIDELIGPYTVNTAPLTTIEAFRDHGEPAASLQAELNQAKNILEALSEAGIDLNSVAAELEVAGISKFNEPYQQMLTAIAGKRKLVSQE